MRTLKKITNLMLLVLCGIFMSSANVLAQCNVDAGQDQQICNGQTSILTASASGGTPPYAYEWSTGESTQSISVSPSENTTYGVTVVDSDGCEVGDNVTTILQDCNGDCNLTVDAGEDQQICNEETAILTVSASGGTPPYAYEWSIGESTQSIAVSPSENTTYSVTVVDSEGCIVTAESQIIIVLCSNIWPGDANNDGIANNNDVLQIGLAYGTTGEARFEASTDWTAQPSTNWDTSFEDGLNHNFGDCDGNGTINDDDVAVVDLNYGQVHGKNEGENGDENDIPLFCELPENIISGGSYSLPIKLGNDEIAAADVYGIAFTVSVTMEEDFEIIEPQINFSESWLGTQGFDMISLSKNVGLNQWDIALARTDQTNISGSGELCSIDCIMEVGSLKNETAFSVPVSVSFSNVTLINAQALEILTNPITTQAEVISSIGETENNVLQTAVYPNPATDILYIDNPNHENLAITVMNVLGQTVGKQNISANENRSTIDVSHLDSGYYLVKIEEANQQKTYKMWID